METERYDRQLSFVAGMAVGAMLMYFLDPDRGRRRRAVARDQAVHLAREVGGAARGAAADVRNRAQGVKAEAQGRSREEQVSDAVLVERVRAELGHATRHAGAIQVAVENGVVTLRGPVLADELADVLSAVRTTRGVEDVENELDVHLRADGVPGLQSAR
ncbi:MAG TPA: BON domain-containing protein [Gemmatimonadaceae bacterium]|jgi:osmotically-inducible protein OsmY|nr:BON domain-containing protein [Gemmatimonadaceae bacterium]